MFLNKQFPSNGHVVFSFQLNNASMLFSIRLSVIFEYMIYVYSINQSSLFPDQHVQK